MRLLVAMAMFLAALLSLTSTMALQSGQVTNRQTITVSATKDAMLGLSAGTGTSNAAGTAHVSPTTGSLKLDFTRGKNSASGYGFAANTAGLTYKDAIRYKGLFKVTNRSADTQCISVYVKTGTVPDLEAIYIRLVGETGTDGWKVAETGGKRISCRPTVLPNAEVLVDFWWSISSDSSGIGSASFDVWVEGIR